MKECMHMNWLAALALTVFAGVLVVLPTVLERTPVPPLATSAVASKCVELRMVLAKSDMVSQDHKFVPVPVYFVKTGDGKRHEVTPEVWAGAEPGKEAPWLSRP